MAKWEEAILELKELGQEPNEFMERTLLKERILDPAYEAAMTNLDLKQPPPTVEQIKRDIRQVGTKVESKRKAQGVRNAKMTQQFHLDQDDCQSEQQCDDEVFRTIAVLVADKAKSNPFFLPPEVWKLMTREQQKMWNDLREASRIRDSSSGTARFTDPKGKGNYGGQKSQSSTRGG